MRLRSKFIRHLSIFQNKAKNPVNFLDARILKSWVQIWVKNVNQCQKQEILSLFLLENDAFLHFAPQKSACFTKIARISLFWNSKKEKSRYYFAFCRNDQKTSRISRAQKTSNHFSRKRFLNLRFFYKLLHFPSRFQRKPARYPLS